MLKTNSTSALDILKTFAIAATMWQSNRNSNSSNNNNYNSKSNDNSNYNNSHSTLCRIRRKGIWI